MHVSADDPRIYPKWATAMMHVLIQGRRVSCAMAAMTNPIREADAPAIFRTGDGTGRLNFATYEDRYDPTLLVMVPGRETPEIRELRRRLLNQRDIASKLLGNPRDASDNRIELHEMLRDVATAHCFRRAPEETLRCARLYGLALLRAAQALVALEDCYRPAESPHDGTG
jgi:hypothetical protein